MLPGKISRRGLTSWQVHVVKLDEGKGIPYELVREEFRKWLSC